MPFSQKRLEPIFAQLARVCGRAKLVYAVTLLPSLALMLSAIVPLVRPADGNDFDWPPALHEAFVRGDLRFGHDIVFPYGPWGFAWGGYDPRTFPITCLVWSAIAIVVWIALLQMVRKRLGNSLWTGLVTLLLVIPWGGDYAPAPDVRLFMLPLLLLLQHFLITDRPTDPAKLALIAALGLAGIIKFTFLVAGGFAIAVICFDLLLRFRPLANVRWLIPAATYVCSLVLFWLLVGQNLLDFSAHIVGAVQIAGGYSEAMALWSQHEARQVATFLIAAFLMLVLIGFGASRTLPRIPLIILLGGLVALLLLVFRAGFVRHDYHELISSGLLLALAPIAAVAAWVPGRVPATGRFSSKLWMPTAWSLCIAAAIYTTWRSGVDWVEGAAPLWPRLLGSVSSDPWNEAVELARLCAGSPSTRGQDWRQYMSQIAQGSPLPPMEGTVDMLPGYTPLLFANHARYEPRPTIKSYSAYTPALSQRNADKLAGPTAPQNLLFQMQGIQGRMPTMDDNRQWLALICHYDLKGVLGTHLHLIKRQLPRRATFTHLGEYAMTIGSGLRLPAEAVALAASAPSSSPLTSPQVNLLWAKIRLTRKPLGRAWAAIYKPPPLYLVAMTQSKQRATFQMICANAEDGFLLGPLPLGNTAMVGILASTPASYAPHMPVALGIADGPVSTGWYFDRAAQLSLYRVEVEPP